jgi:hypothetical protein
MVKCHFLKTTKSRAFIRDFVVKELYVLYRVYLNTHFYYRIFIWFQNLYYQTRTNKSFRFLQFRFLQSANVMLDNS